MQADIPVELTGFVPNEVGTMNLPMWKIVHEKDCEEILFCKNSPFNKWVAFSIVLPSTFCVFFAVLAYRFAESFPPDAAHIPFYIICVTLALIPFFCVIAPLVNWIFISLNASYWKGPLRFRYNIKTNELYFPREDAFYKATDYLQLVFGYTFGSDASNARPSTDGGISWPGYVHAPPITVQFYAILQKKDGQWVRHTLALDAIPTTIKQAIKVLENYLTFEVIVRKMTVKECYNEQHAMKEKEVREVITTKETVEVKEIKEVVAKKKEKQILLQQTWGTPPRSVSLRTQLAILTNVNMTYWIFACLGLLIALFALPLCLSSFEDAFHSNFQPAGKGVIVARVETHVRMNKRANSHRQGEPVFCYVIKKRAKEDQTDTSGMEQGQTCYDKRLYEVGEEVAIEQSGDRYRVVGSTCSALGKSGVMVGLIPFLFASIGLGGIVLGIRRGCQRLSILQSGKVEYGRLVKMSSPEPSLEGSGSQSYYCFMPDEHQNVSPMFYDPIDPRRSMMLDDLPVGTRFDPFTQTFRTSFRGVIVPLLLSILVGSTFIALIYAVAVSVFV